MKGPVKTTNKPQRYVSDLSGSSGGQMVQGGQGDQTPGGYGLGRTARITKASAPQGIYKAIAKAASLIPTSKPLILHVKSKAVIQELMKKRARNEDGDWINKAESNAQRAAIANIRAREAWTAFIMTLLKGRNTSVKQAREAAKEVTEAGPVEELTVPPPHQSSQYTEQNSLPLLSALYTGASSGKRNPQ
ncbi:hypothetical protein PUNSTDRAFT_46696 [Punctularia strigosozonata HHB-11173 SS5]|uniref:uncharacterized protein n=1 Tax=Punctularia strigosozonata (strain HHB-11173) TaxID=741275 RepID=UPI00044176C0|nr:uncharacterized protein PUNSTDRAFT_46696 [Punctularia strigosozonata HHB-11173 SS5]EIN05876.1 hypothetical protein PUNSTDRAFT_46696 [Punctularia strigosozonata HHB-11173 SS5]